MTGPQIRVQGAALIEPTDRFAERLHTFLVDLQEEADALRRAAASMNADPYWAGKGSPAADAVEAWADRLQALIDKHGRGGSS